MEIIEIALIVSTRKDLFLRSLLNLFLKDSLL